MPYTVLFETEMENEKIIPCRAMAFVKHTINDFGGKFLGEGPIRTVLGENDSNNLLNFQRAID